MISHKHKCIFIHITKCAGTSVEHAFGIKTRDPFIEDKENLFGWDSNHQLWLQHATPQQLLDLNLISESIWNSYYKFIIFRNSWDRAHSDYFYLQDKFEINDSFFNYLNRKGKFFEMLDKSGGEQYVGDHLNSQKSYFFLNGKRITYNQEVNFENLKKGLQNVCKELSLPKDFFDFHLNRTTKKSHLHYSHFYNLKKINMIKNQYSEDIEFFKFKFDDRRTFYQKLKNELFQ